MFLELIATFVFGFGAAGLVLILNALTGRRLPRALMPIGAGAAMIGFTIWNEYNWYPRTVSELPEGIEVVSVHESQAFYRPWTFLKPFIDRFAAVDLGTAQRNPDVPEQVLVMQYLMGRWAPGTRFPVVVDCGASRRATLADGMEFDDVGAVVSADWITVEASDPLLEAVCT